ncbi:uncharacterized protein LOC126597241 [Malus sylvestris]|uniref:uncharacterized protein LOC126597241 n=1 Tax=Malus sylvestris TaxID=3752 RepID=UPI0021AD1E83|nr:uncharacterized protein LOC126597241 [Malus sylvestris]
MTISAFVVPDHVRRCGIVPNLRQSLFQTAGILCSSRRLNPASSVTKPSQSRPQLLLTKQSQSATQPQQQQLVVHNSTGSLSFNSNMSKEDKEMSRSAHAPMPHVTQPSGSPAIYSRLASCSGIPRAPSPI